MQLRALTFLASAAAVAMASPMILTENIPRAVLESSDVEILKHRANDQTPTPFMAYQQYQFPAQLAQTAYCGQAVGSSVGDARLLWTGGNGRSIPMAYVAYSASKGVIVAHQGTNASSFSSLFNNADFDKVPIDSRIAYLGQAEVHNGFQAAWLRTADQVLAQVKSALAAHPGAPVFTVGHSLGAAISLFDALYLKRKLPNSRVTAVGFAMPRVGDPTFAKAVDANLPGYVHINNGRDPVPRVPGGGLGFQQVSGEIWINPADGLAAVSCPGQENKNCILSINPLLFDVDDHTGRYFNVHIAGRGKNCPAVIG